VENSTNIILASPPSYTRQAESSGLTTAHMLYRVGRGFHLYRADAPVSPSGGLMMIDMSGFSDGGPTEILISEILGECRRFGYTGVVLDISGRVSPLVRSLAEILTQVAKETGLRIFIPKSIAGSGDNFFVLVSTAITEGSLSKHLSDAVAQYGAARVALEIECMRTDFTLSSANDSGYDLSPEELNHLIKSRGATVFFSKELSTFYFTYRTKSESHFVLYDDGLSIKRKLRIAEALGIKTAFFTTLMYVIIWTIFSRNFRPVQPTRES